MADLSVRLLVMAMAVLCSSCLARADCMDVVISLSPCLDYIMNNNGTSQPPPSECCLQLMTVVRSQPLCLCTILDGEVEAKLGIPIDKNRALALPAACGVQTPPVSECKGLQPWHDIFIISKIFFSFLKFLSFLSNINFLGSDSPVMLESPTLDIRRWRY